MEHFTASETAFDFCASGPILRISFFGLLHIQEMEKQKERKKREEENKEEKKTQRKQ